MSIDRAVLEQLDRVGARLSEGKALRLLEDIAWPREVEERFFAAGEDRLPEIEHRVDRDGLARPFVCMIAMPRTVERGRARAGVR